jgi:RNA polymerase subunit RPABC4/transcription elongation factor Spt4
MSPATVKYPQSDINVSQTELKTESKREKKDRINFLCKKLILEHGGKFHNLPAMIGSSGKEISEILFEIDEKAKMTGSDPVYSKLYRRLKLLSKYHLFNLIRKEKVDWEATRKAREDEIRKSVRAIFSAAVERDTPPIISSVTLPREGKTEISTVKVTEKIIHVVPTGSLIYLFSQVQNSSATEKSAKKQTGKWWDRIYNIPARCGSDRVDAIRTLMDIQGRSWFQRDCTCPACGKIGKQIPGKKIAICECGWQWTPPIQPRLKRKLNYCQTTFGFWEEATLGKELFFDRGPGSDMVRLPCRTRFTDKGRKVKNIRTYDRAWSRANLLFSRGVFLTLTTDPSLHKSLWHANRHLTRAWNRYLTLLVTKKKKAKKAGYSTEKEEHDQLDNGTGRLKYIAAYEFQENGLIHLHVCFFGIRYLASMDQIAKDWNGCGQGRIAHVYGIRRNGEVWEWNREKPADAAGKSPVDYLRKYLEKALYVSEHFPMYWAINKRFVSMSRMFQTKECEGCRSVWGSWLKVCPECGAPLKQISKGYRYLVVMVKDKPQKGYNPFKGSPTVEMMNKHWSPMRETSIIAGAVPS